MASKIKVDQIEGSTGSTVTIPTGQTLTITDGLAVASLPTVTVAKGGTNLTSFTAGDVLYATGSTTLAKLPKGTAEQVLAMNAGATAPDWGSVDLTVLPTISVAKGGTNLSSFTAGDILYATGTTTLAKLAKGTANQTLQMNSGATAPTWTTVAAGSGALTRVGGSLISGGTAAQVEYQDVFTSTYRDYLVTWSDIKNTSASGNGAWLELGLMSSSGHESSNTYYAKYLQMTGNISASNNGFGNQSDSGGIRLANTWNMQSSGYNNFECAGFCWLPHPYDNDTAQTFHFNSQWHDSGHIGWSTGLGMYNTQVVATGIIMRVDNGAITDGEINIYGYEKT